MTGLGLSVTTNSSTCRSHSSVFLVAFGIHFSHFLAVFRFWFGDVCSQTWARWCSHIIAVWISSIVLHHPEHWDHMLSVPPSLSFFLSSQLFFFLTVPLSVYCHPGCIHMTGSGECWVSVRAFYFSEWGYITVKKNLSLWEVKKAEEPEKQPSWNFKKGFNFQFFFQRQCQPKEFWILSILMIGSPFCTFFFFQNSWIFYSTRWE